MAGFDKKIYWIVLVLLFFMNSLTGASQDTLKILPLGNSITRGTMCLNGSIWTCQKNADSVAVGYRLQLYDLLRNAGYTFDIVGGNHFGGSLLDDPDNAGFDGIKAASLAQVMSTGYSLHTGRVAPGPYLESFPANVVLLHIGTNDIVVDHDTTTSINEVSNILDAIDAYEISSGHPVLVILARIISEYGYDCNTNNEVVAFNRRLSSMAQTRINNGDHIVVVDMECGAGINYFTNMTDQVHPTAAGYAKMGDLWFETLDQYNSAPVIDSIPNQVKDRHEPFDTLLLDNYVSDDVNTPDEITWSFVPPNPEHFNLTIDSNHRLTVVPLDTTWSGSDTILLTATDKGKVITALKKSDSTQIIFTVQWIPEITGQADLSTPEETAITLNPADLVMVEPEKAPSGLQIHIYSGDHYSVSGSTIVPATDFNGTLNVPVSISDGNKESNIYTVKIEVTPVNDPPLILSQDSIVTDRNRSVPVDISMIDFTDPDNATQEHALYLTGGENYTLKGDTIIPAVNFYGTLSVNAHLTDLTDTTSFILAVQVNFINIPPHFSSIPDTSVDEHSPYTYVLIANDPDISDTLLDQTLNYWTDTLPAWLSFNTQSNILVGIPGDNDVGKYQISLGVTDGIDSVYQAFSLTVMNINDPPIITGQKDISARPNSYTILSVDELIIEDPDNLPDEMKIVIYPGTHYTFVGDTIFFNHDYRGMIDVPMQVNDGTDDSNIFDLQINVDFPDHVSSLATSLIINVYPNPASGQVTFEYSRNMHGLLELRDLTGKIFVQKNLDHTEGKCTLDISQLPRGIYIYRVFNNYEERTGKLIIQ